MNSSNKNQKTTNQKHQNQLTSRKHEANLKYNHTIYFLVSLVLVLSVVYGLFEMQFKADPIQLDNRVAIAYEDDYYFNKQVVVFKEEAPEKKQSNEKHRIPEDPKVVDNDYKDVESTVFSDLDDDTAKTPVEEAIPEVYNPEDDDPVNIMAVEQVPIYPGCESFTSNTERRACMEENIRKLINKKFNTNLATDYGLSGVQRISVQFKIDKSGKVTEVLTRAPHKKLEKEAERVINKIPTMIPGKQKNREVEVIYQLPIIFKVQDY